MKKTCFFFALVLLVSCANYTKSKTEPFTIEGASFNYWTGGQAGVGGTRIIVAFTTKEKVDFKKIFFQGKSANVEYKDQKGKTYLFAFINKSRQQPTVLDIDSSKEIKNQKPDISLPFKLKDKEIAISYTENGELKYYLIKDVKQTESDYYP